MFLDSSVEASEESAVGGFLLLFLFLFTSVV